MKADGSKGSSGSCGVALEIAEYSEEGLLDGAEELRESGSDREDARLKEGKPKNPGRCGDNGEASSRGGNGGLVNGRESGDSMGEVGVDTSDEADGN